jgi:hypothetical protein
MRIATFALMFSFAMLGLAAQDADPQSQEGLNSPLRADQQEKLVYIDSSVIFEYHHDKFEEGSTGESKLIHWLHARLALYIEKRYGSSSRFPAG